MDRSSCVLPAHVAVPQHTACVRPAYVAALATRAPPPQPPRSLHGVKRKSFTERAVMSPNTYESWIHLPVSRQAEGVRAPSLQRIGREKAAGTHR